MYPENIFLKTFVPWEMSGPVHRSAALRCRAFSGEKSFSPPLEREKQGHRKIRFYKGKEAFLCIMLKTKYCRKKELETLLLIVWNLIFYSQTKYRHFGFGREIHFIRIITGLSLSVFNNQQITSSDIIAAGQFVSCTAIFLKCVAGLNGNRCFQCQK